MKFTLPDLDAARARGAAVTSEMELFFDLCPCKIYAVTGSDGKTTTTTIVSEFLKAAGKKVHLGGNIGRPLLPESERVAPDDVAEMCIRYSRKYEGQSRWADRFPADSPHSPDTEYGRRAPARCPCNPP